MKTLSLIVTLLIYVTCFGQEKPIYRFTQKVNLFIQDDSNIVFLTDSSGKQIHSKLEVLEIDSTVFEGHQVILLYGEDVVISFSELYIAYDTFTEGFVYLNPKKD